MRNSLVSALLVAVATALENEVVVLDAFEFRDTSVEGDEKPLMGTLTVKTGWKSQGGDGIIDYELQMLTVGTEDYPNFHSTWAEWTLAMSQNATVEKSEVYRLKAEENSDNQLLDYLYYDTEDANESTIEGSGADPANVFRFVLSADADYTVRNSEIAPGNSYWKVDQSSRRYDQTRTTSLVLTRSEGGYSDIKVGSTIKASLFRASDAIIDSQDLTWKVADKNDSDNDNDNDNSNVSDTQDDGATAVTTFGAAVIAAVASLLF